MTRKDRSWRVRAAAAACAAVVGAFIIFGSIGPRGGPLGTGERTVTAQATDQPNVESEAASGELLPMSVPEPNTFYGFTAAQRAQAYRSLLDNRERMAQRSIDHNALNVRSPFIRSRSQAAPTQLINDQTQAFTDFVIGRNNQNPEAAGFGPSTVNEPAMGNDGREIFMTFNWGATKSADGGVTWSPVPIIEPFADASFCCDQDVSYYAPTGTTFWSVLYCDAACNRGRTVVFVIPRISTGVACYYTVFDGFSTGSIPDYPHLGQSQKMIYLSANNVGTVWNSSQMIRLDAEAMSNCVSASFALYTYTGTVGQRVFVPGLGAQATQYWFSAENSSTLRIFKWPETSSTVSEFLRSVPPITFANPDCRGGANNVDWIDNFTAWSAQGFTARTGIGGAQLLFNIDSANDASHPQAYVHVSNFQEPNLVFQAEPDIFNSSVCFGYPAVTANERTGHFGLAIAAGGRAGGGGPPVQGYVGIDDDFTPGIGVYGSVVLVAAGTHNPSRFGDYYSIGTNRPCGYFWDAALFALNGGTSSANVNARYVEFGRGREMNCYRWTTLIRP
jgi:hypothetical protein